METDALRAWPATTNFQTDLADLAARFAARGGAPEFAAQLALEIVLNEIVEQGCLATGASGVAIALERNHELECRATTGLTAPELGAPLDTGQGLSGECIRTRKIQICHDTETDARVDARASHELGVRSVIVLPLVRGTELLGVLEAFSTKPSAFGERDQRTLEALTQRVLHNIELAAHWSAGARDRIVAKTAETDTSEIDQAKIEEAKIEEARTEEAGIEETAIKEAKIEQIGSEQQKTGEVKTADAILSDLNVAGYVTASATGEQEPHFHFPPDALKRTVGSSHDEPRVDEAHAAEASDLRSANPHSADLQSADLGPGHAGSAEVLMSAIQSRVPPSRVISFLTALMGGIICLTAIGLTLRVAQRFGWVDFGAHSRPGVTTAQAASAMNQPSATASVPGSSYSVESSSDRISAKSTSANAASSLAATSNTGSAGGKALPPGSMLVTENGKEVFRMTPVFSNNQSNTQSNNQSDNQANGRTGTQQDKTAADNSSSVAKTGIEQAAAIEPEKVAGEPIMELSPSAAEEGLLRRVEPEYPEAARQQKIQGAVVLDVRVRRDGTVQQATLVSGDSLLANAAIAAVNRWQFKPHFVNGQTVAMQTRVTLNFRLSR
jgi:TonB family protein